MHDVPCLTIVLHTIAMAAENADAHSSMFSLQMLLVIQHRTLRVSCSVLFFGGGGRPRC